MPVVLCCHFQCTLYCHSIPYSKITTWFFLPLALKTVDVFDDPQTPDAPEARAVSQPEGHNCTMRHRSPRYTTSLFFFFLYFNYFLKNPKRILHFKFYCLKVFQYFSTFHFWERRDSLIRLVNKGARCETKVIWQLFAIRSCFVFYLSVASFKLKQLFIFATGAHSLRFAHAASFFVCLFVEWKVAVLWRFVPVKALKYVSQTISPLCSLLMKNTNCSKRLESSPYEPIFFFAASHITHSTGFIVKQSTMN